MIWTLPSPPKCPEFWSHYHVKKSIPFKNSGLWRTETQAVGSIRLLWSQSKRQNPVRGELWSCGFTAGKALCRFFLEYINCPSRATQVSFPHCLHFSCLHLFALCCPHRHTLASSRYGFGCVRVGGHSESSLVIVSTSLCSDMLAAASICHSYFLRIKHQKIVTKLSDSWAFILRFHRLLYNFTYECLTLEDCIYFWRMLFVEVEKLSFW